MGISGGREVLINYQFKSAFKRPRPILKDNTKHACYLMLLLVSSLYSAVAYGYCCTRKNTLLL
jgi:hypothetical protein